MINIIPNGFIARFLEVIGFQPTSLTSQYFAYTLCGTFFVALSIALLVLLFKFLVYISKR